MLLFLHSLTEIEDHSLKIFGVWQKRGDIAERYISNRKKKRKERHSSLLPLLLGLGSGLIYFCKWNILYMLIKLSCQEVILWLIIFLLHFKTWPLSCVISPLWEVIQLCCRMHVQWMPLGGRCESPSELSAGASDASNSGWGSMPGSVSR